MTSVAVGGVFLRTTCSSLPSSNLLRGSHVSSRANSVTWNPHKMMGVLLQCSAILVKEKVCIPSGSKHIPELEKGTLGSPIVSLQTVLACPPSNLYFPLVSCCGLPFVLGCFGTLLVTDPLVKFFEYFFMSAQT